MKNDQFQNMGKQIKKATKNNKNKKKQQNNITAASQKII